MTKGSHDPAFARVATEMRNSALQMEKVPEEIHYAGLTKREYFAAMAMQGCIQWDAIVNEHNETASLAELAKRSVAMADALIAELNK